MDKSENIFLENCRVKLAKEFKIPPDDIDILSIINCSKRAIIENCSRNNQDGPIIAPLTEEEKKAIFSEHSPTIIHKIFSGEAPFYTWADKFEENYVKAFLEKMNKKDKL